MPATESENRLPRKLLGAWCYNCSRLRGGQRENICKTYLDLLNSNLMNVWDPILGTSSNHGELSCIFALITGDNVEFKTCVLTMVSMNWLMIRHLDSTAPVL